jgi:hypothetical protein
LALAGFLLMTMHWRSWTAGVHELGAQDSLTYSRISAAAPGLPAKGIGSAFAYRFVLHWAVGSVSWLTGIQLHATYTLAWAALSTTILLVVVLIARRLRLDAFATVVVVLVVAFSPYLIRYYAIAPGYISDQLFMVGLAVTLLGLARNHIPLVVLGVVVAVVARQTGFLLAPASAVWIWWGDGWKERSRGARLTFVVSICGITALLGGALTAASSSWSYPYDPSFPGDTIFRSQANAVPAHVAKSVAPLFTCFALLAVALWYLPRDARGRPRIPVEVGAALCIAAAVALQTILIGPQFPGLKGNEPRLTALALPALAVALAYALRANGFSADVGAAPAIWDVRAFAIVALLALGSLHHLYTIVGPSGQGQFIALELASGVAAAGLLAWILQSRRDVARPLEQPAPGGNRNPIQHGLQERPPIRP